MEEFVGQLWHRLVTRHAQIEHPNAEVKLTEIAHRLAPYYRAMGGAAGKLIEGAPTRRVNTQRRLRDQLAGTQRHFPLSWQDDRSVRLPKSIACFPNQELNESLYYWLTALAARQPIIQHWFLDNQRACQQLLANYPGLHKTYLQLTEATIGLRHQWCRLEGAELEREQAIRAALMNPGSVSSLPRASREPLPVPLWLYPEPLHAVSVSAEESMDSVSETNAAPPQNLDQGERKAAERIDDRRETDGLMVFQLASLFSWTEQVAVDRCQDEDTDDESPKAVEDIDIITLARQRRAGAAKVKFDLDLPAAENDELPLGDGILLPEWDFRKSELVQNYCLLQPLLADHAVPASVPDTLKNAARSLRNRFSMLRPQRQWQLRQPVGEELDLNAYLDTLTQPEPKAEHQDLFKARTPMGRELSCLLLADLSMSTDVALTEKQRVIDVIRHTLLLFAEALSGSGDRFAIYGFSSVKNKQVRYHLLKNFAEAYSDQTRGRILAIKPGFYTRMGAAIRQSTEILKTQKTQQLLLLIVSDGKPNDIDHYEGRYGIEDTRQAILEAKQQGLLPFCVTVDDKASDYLPYLFGGQGYAMVSDVQRLPHLLPKLYLNLTGAIS
ncbi:MAG: nitric oxide reductase activation protein NorD [Pseudomonadales bacterium]|nr:nitric oxide reductase activation protein NorD [Pseudomonadales bacterium]